MSSVKLLLNKDRVLKDGAYPLVFQMIHRRRKKLIYTPFKLFPEEFNATNEKIVYIADTIRRLKDVRSINRSIAEQRRSIESHILGLEQRDEEYSVDDLVARYKVEHNPQSLLHYMDTQIKLKKELLKEGTVAAYRSTRASVALFIGNKEITVSQVTSAFLRSYELHLQRRGVCDNTVCFYVRNLKSMYNQALVDGHRPAEENPFKNLRAKPRKTTKRAIDSELIRRIAELDLSNKPHLDIARDIFMFGFFARGMSFVDIIRLKRPRSIINYERIKTHQELNVAVTSQLMAIITKYESKSEFVFPIQDPFSPKPMYKQYRQALERTNRNLKQVGRLLGVETALTTYVARHSWATGAKNMGAPIAAISESLGHTSEKTTAIYLKGLDQTVLDQLNEKVSGFHVSAAK